LYFNNRAKSRVGHIGANPNPWFATYTDRTWYHPLKLNQMTGSTLLRLAVCTAVSCKSQYIEADRIFLHSKISTLTTPKFLVYLVRRRSRCPIVSLRKLSIMLLNLSLLALTISIARLAPVMDLWGAFVAVLTLPYRASSWAGSGLLCFFGSRTS
jgi:hypothetical protein